VTSFRDVSLISIVATVLGLCYCVRIDVLGQSDGRLRPRAGPGSRLRRGFRGGLPREDGEEDPHEEHLFWDLWEDEGGIGVTRSYPSE
jgi:hypothetical protein